MAVRRTARRCRSSRLASARPPDDDAGGRDCAHARPDGMPRGGRPREVAGARWLRRKLFRRQRSAWLTVSRRWPWRCSNFRLRPRQLGACLTDIGFVLPNCAQPGRGGDSRPRIACSAAIGFVLPNAAKPGGGGDSRPWIACPAATGFVLPNALEPRGASDAGPRIAWRPLRPRLALQGVEGLDGGVSPRQGPALVAVEPHQARRDVVLGESLGDDPG